MLRAIASVSSSSSAAPRLPMTSLGLGLGSVRATHLGIVARPYLVVSSSRSGLEGPSMSSRRFASSKTDVPGTKESPEAHLTSPNVTSATPSSTSPSTPSPIPATLGASPPPSPSSSSSSSGSSGKSGRLRRAGSALLWLPVIYFVMHHVVGLGQLHGESMSPTINPPNPDGSPSRTSDVVLLDRYVGSTYAFKVGDIVTLRSPSNPDQLLTKRILAMEGDAVTVRLPMETTHAFPGASTSTSTLPSPSVLKGKGRPRSLGSNLPPSSLGDGEVDEMPIATLRLRVPPGHVWVEGDASVAEEATWQAQRSLAPSPLPPLQKGPPGRTRSRDSREFGPVPLGLLEARVSFILWPLAHFGRPGPRPGFDADGMMERRQLKVDRVKRYIGSGLAHPEDSSISPYLDWDDGQEETEEDPTVKYPTPKEDWEKVEEIWRAQLNRLSRGGSLGDHAGRDEV